MKRLYVIGMGPGGADQLTPQALRALEDSRVVCGYTTYMDLAWAFLEGKELVTTPMTRELERCRIALERAEAGETTAMICSGDAGVYGMAGRSSRWQRSSRRWRSRWFRGSPPPCPAPLCWERR